MKDSKKDVKNNNEIAGVVDGAELTDDIIEKVTGGVTEAPVTAGTNCN